MRTGLRPATLLLVAMILAGCTSEGNLGAIDERDQAAQAQARAASTWEPASASHRGSVTVSGTTLEVDGDLPALSLTTLALGPHATTPPPAFASTLALPRFGLVGATIDGERGTLVMNASEGARLDAIDGGRIVVTGHALRAHGAVLYAGLPTEGAPALKPQGTTALRVMGLDLPSAVTARGGEFVFFTDSGARHVRTGPMVVGTDNATLAALVDGMAADGTRIELPLEAAPGGTWRGNLTVSAVAPTGTLRLPSGERLLALHNLVSFKMRGEGPLTLTSGEHAWTFAQDNVEFVDVRTGGTSHLAATLRLAPDLVNATGPAGNVTRVQLILAETSLGAEAHVTGYRIDPTVQARYVGGEPFAVTNALLRLLNETQGQPIAPAMLLAVGISVPFFAIGEAFAGVFQALFPPSLEGAIGPGEARLLTFELVLPDAPRDVEILIEAENAEAVRAVLRLTPTPAATSEG